MPEETQSQGQDQTQGKETTQQGEPKFTQAELDRIVQDRLNRDRQKFADYEDLRNKVSEYEKHKEQLSQQELENKKEYEKLKEGWAQKESEYQSKLNEYNQQIQSERIGNSLNQQILKNNAYPEAVELIRSKAKYNEDGTITIRGKDANGIETDLPIDKGVEQFLKERPFLVKGSGQGGGGTGTGSGTGGQGEEKIDLANELENAMAVGDRKRAKELKEKIRQKHSTFSNVAF